MKRSAVAAGASLLLGMALGARAGAEEAAAPPYTGGIVTETSTFTGDWRGYRNDLAAKGITLDARVTQVEQGVVSGGKNGAWEYGGRGDLTGNLDTRKLGLWPDGFLTVELEGNWGNSVIGNTGSIMPANTNQLFPVPLGSNVALPELSFTQLLSDYGGLVVGKLETISGDENEFAHGKGDTQFMNLAFNFNPVALMTTPYSTLGGGAFLSPTKNPDAASVKFLVISSSGSATTAGFDELSGDNLTFSAEGRVRIGPFGLTGHQLVGAQYSNALFTQLDQRIATAIQNRSLVPKRDSWDVYYNFDQFLYETDQSKGQGIGLFGRFGASDGNSNPINYFASAGVGGKGLIQGRALDAFGVGYYYIWVHNPTLEFPFSTRSFLRDEWGIEAYYDVAITPWMLLTPDLQVIGPSQKRERIAFRTGESIGTATVLGVRLQLIL